MNQHNGGYEFGVFKAGAMAQVDFKCGADIAALAQLDRKQWLALSMPINGVRFDRRMLEFMDSDGDGRIRTAEVVAAVEFMKNHGVDFDSLFAPTEEDRAALEEVMAKSADLAKFPPSAEDLSAKAKWEEEGRKPEIAICGESTAAAEAALKAVEPIIDAFFMPPADMPLVTDEPDKTLPLKDHLNPLHLEAILDFAEKCVKPVLGEKTEIGRLEFKRVKAAFAPYRAWIASEPVMNAGAKGKLEEEEKLLRYKLNFVEFLENFVNMKRLYAGEGGAIFQTGVLRIDAREMNLCFHVDSEAAHSALAGKSKCCVIYLKLTRKSDAAERLICAVVTAGTVGGLYPGRNGVFIDRDGKDWEAVITKVVESQVSLLEAFWAPWRKIGEGISGLVKKFLGDRQSAATASVTAGTKDAQAGGAAMASSVAAIGIGVAMVGGALASILATVKGMGPLQILISIAAVIAVVSLPSVILTYFKLRQRDLGAILNASGWAINRQMRFSIKRAAVFTRKLVRCSWQSCWCHWRIRLCVILWVIAIAVIAMNLFFWS